MYSLIVLSCLRSSSYFMKTLRNKTNCSTMAGNSTHLVFLYGTLRRGEPNHYLLEDKDVKFVGRACTLKKWPLVIASRYNIPYLLYAENKGKHVTGDVFEVCDAVLASLDELECHPTYYERIKEDVVLYANSKETIFRPWIYFFKKYKPELLNLPFLEEYSSKGPHGLQYVERYKRNGSNYYADVMENSCLEDF